MSSASKFGVLKTAALAVACCLGVGGVAQGQVKISQVYGAGGNGGATYASDFIELYNAGAPQLLTGWSVQYASDTGTTWSVTNLPAVTLGTGKYLLVQESTGTGWPVGQAAALPTPDVTGTIAMAASAGKVALCNSTTALSGSQCPTPGASVMDMVGFGTTANCREPQSGGSTANNTPAPILGMSVMRNVCGVQDTSNNAADFANAFPSPRNTATAANLGLSGIGWASPGMVEAGAQARLIITPRLCATNILNPGTTATADLTSIGGSATQTLFDNGTNGDEAASDGIYSFMATVAGGTSAGTKSIPVTFSDGSNSGGAYISLVVNAASAPDNDNCATAQNIVGPYLTPVNTSGTFTGATVEYNATATNPIAPSPPYFGSTATGMIGSTGGRRGLWYTVTGSGNTLSASLCPGAALDSLIEVFCGTCDGLSIVATGDDDGPSCAGTQASTSWCTLPGQTYYVWISPFGGGAVTTAFTLRISDNGVACSGAVVCSTCTIGCPGGATKEAEAGFGPATNDGCDSTPNLFTDLGSLGTGTVNVCGTARGYDDGRDVDWYRFQSTVTDIISVSLTAQFSGIVSLRQLGAAGICTGATTLVSSTSSNRCAPISINSSVTAGTWYAVRIIQAPTPSMFGGVMVGATSYNYTGSIAIGGPPPNDNCASASVIASTGTGAGGVNGNSAAATLDGPNPTTGCSPNVNVDRDVWYSFQPSCTGAYNISLCSGTAFDTVLEVWNGCPAASGAVVACNDDDAGCGSGTQSRILGLVLSSSTTYKIRVMSKGNPAAGGAFNLVVVPATPGNDVCMGGGDPLYTIPGSGGTMIGNLTPANSEGNAANSCQSGTGQKDLFYYFTPSSSCPWTISLCSTSPSIDTAISIGTLCPTPSLSNATTCDDDGCGTLAGLSRMLNLTLTAGTPYIIRVAQFSSSVTTGCFTLTVTPGAPANDTCATATLLSTGGGTATVTADNSCATDDGLVPSCGATSKDLWWTLTTTASQAGNWRINTCGSLIDTVLTVYNTSCAVPTEVASGCNDDATSGICSGSSQSEVLVSLAASTTYRIRVASKGVSAGGAITLKVNAEIPPANNNCSGAIALTLGAAAVSGNTALATNDGTASCDPGGASSRDVWYSVVLSSALAANQQLSIDTCGSAMDTVLSAYSGTCAVPVEIGCNDDCGGSPCGATSSCLTFSGLPAGTYLIRVSDKGAAVGGVINIKAALTVVNDTCGGAIAVTCPSVSTGTTVGATIDSSAPDCTPVAPSIANNSGSSAVTAPGVWYSIVGTGATVTADTITGTSFDSKLSVYTGPNCATLSCVTMNDDISAGFRSKVAFATTPGQIYWILVHAFSTNTGTYSLNVYCDPTPANDGCGSATMLTDSAGSLSGQTTVGSTATVFTPVSNLLATCATNANDPLFDVWYTITACATGNLTVTTCGTYDTLLSVHTGCPTATVSNQLTPTGSSCNDNGAGACAPGSSVTVAVTAGTPYFIRVAGGIGINAGGTFTLTWSLPETVPPVIGTCSSNQTANADAGCQAAVPNFTTGVSASDNCTASGNLVITQSPLAGTLVGLGVTNVTVSVADKAGNIATCNPTFTVSDVTAPVIGTCAGDQSASADANCQAAVPDFTAGVSATDNCTATGSLVITQTPTAGTLVGLGAHAVTISVKDAANNESTCQAMFTVSDTTAPAIADCPADIGPVPTDAGQPTAVVTWTAPTATDNCNLVSFVSTHNPGDAFPVGVTSVTYTATDGVGHITTCIFSITVVDNESPVIHNCPKTIMADADAGLCSTTVTWTAPTATDNQPGVSIVQTQGPASGSSFPVGTTHIVYTATDASNNTATCAFDVIVSDTQDPVIHDCPGNIALGTEAPNCSAVATWTAPTATDNCSVQSLVSTHNSGDTFPLGPTMVTYTATDVNGRVSTCNFTVTVTDDDAPSISVCAGNQSANADANCQAAVPDFTGGVTASDNCTASGSLVISQVPLVGTLVGPGPTAVTITVKDAANNSTTCGATFTVNDVTPPVIAGCPSNITSNTNAPNCAAVVSWTPPTASDNCSSSISQTQGPAPGSTFANGSTTTIEYTATDGTNSVTCSFTVHVVATPDVNNDSVVNSSDVGPFIQVLLGLDTTPLHVYRSDTNCDGVVNGRDIPGMVDALIP